eukprot:TRINITY_DN34131_c0_g1_i1.p2 TRINITY_DN34131_c0_g1~~TRINITY_DN34131_c0_g1_i1.p2  ORF type:complete len:137 (+),score=11.60 TRINITY_DN34131_c0_g1_i1:431-841(+)
MVCGELCTNFYKRIHGYTKFSYFRFWLNLSFCEVAALCLGNVFHFTGTRAKLQGGVTVFLYCALSNNLTAVELQNCYWHVVTGVVKHAGHTKLLCNQTLSLIHISEPTRLLSISYAVFCLKKKNSQEHKTSILTAK